MGSKKRAKAKAALGRFNEEEVQAGRELLARIEQMESRIQQLEQARRHDALVVHALRITRSVGASAGAPCAAPTEPAPVDAGGGA